MTRMPFTALALALAALHSCQPAQADTIRVIDGDTIDAGHGANVRLTLEGGLPFDTPETWSPGCEFEAFVGAMATERLIELIAAGQAGLTLLPGRDRYGRHLGALRVDGVNVGQILIGEGLALPVMNHNWCEGRD